MKNYWEKSDVNWSEDSVRHISTPSIEARSTFFHIQEIGHFKTLYPFYTERQYLNSYLIVYTVSGRGNLKYKDKMYSVGPGTFFFINCYSYQLYEALRDEPWEILWVHFNGSSTSEYYHHYSKRKSPVEIVHQNSEVPTFIKQLINLQQEDGTSLKAEIISSKIIVELLTSVLLNDIENYRPQFVAPDYIIKMKKELDLNFNKKITLDILSQLFAMNKYQLAKEFKQFTGLSPNEYLINRRITKAKELLKQTDHSISSISHDVGIENVSHFINLFKGRVDSTPLSFRKQWRDG